MGEPTLLPCPFCGGEAKYEMLGRHLTIWCGNLDCAISPEIASITAVEKWNRRAPNPLAATLAARDPRVTPRTGEEE